MSQPHAVIFDLDDTLAATSSAWRHAEEELLRRLGAEYDDTFLGELNGRSAQDVVKIIQGRSRTDLPRMACEALFIDLLADAVENTVSIAKPGALAAVRRMSNGDLLAIASGSPRRVIDRVLVRLGLSTVFSCVVSSEEVAAGKPSPLVLLAAANRLAVAPSRCLVVEDSLAGVRAARTAGMVCVAVPSRPAEIPTIATLAHLLLENLDQLDPAAVKQLLRRRETNHETDVPCY